MRSQRMPKLSPVTWTVETLTTQCHSDNRPDSYRHGFLNGRDDLSGKPRATAETLREQADIAMEKDTTP